MAPTTLISRWAHFVTSMGVLFERIVTIWACFQIWSKKKLLYDCINCVGVLRNKQLHKFDLRYHFIHQETHCVISLLLQSEKLIMFLKGLQTFPPEKLSMFLTHCQINLCLGLVVWSRLRQVWHVHHSLVAQFALENFILQEAFLLYTWGRASNWTKTSNYP